MPKNSFVAQLASDFPQFKFTESDSFHYRSSSETIYFDPRDPNFELLLLHELAHALLEHNNYKFDIELVRIEADAWEYTVKKLAPKYNIFINQDLTETTLETYRNWLYERSCCPHCQSIGYQLPDTSYSCLECGTKWRANLAKFTFLKRRKI